MSEHDRCPDCGAELVPFQGMASCPACLMGLGLASEGAAPPSAADAVPRSAAPRGERFVAPEPDQLARLFPQLEILELLGKGGMGAVYKARQPGLDRLVAVKILPAEMGSDPAFAERFAREARALARLNHPNIVAIYDYGQTSGLVYFVMEYVDGANLRQVVRKHPPEPSQALALVSQICDALQFAHDEGIVHRDIKPENILVDRRGRAKIADFGLAKLLDTLPTETALTQDRQAMGTLHYMAPEQMRGSGRIDHRADLYSLGVVFYELLTGELPLGRFSLPSEKPHVDPRLDEIVLRSLEREPEQRYQRASEIRSDIQTVVDHAGAPPATLSDELCAAVPVDSRPGWASAARDPRSAPLPPPRFSRKAIIGAIWAPLSLPLMIAMVLVPYFMVRVSGSGAPAGMSILGLLVILCASVVGLSSLFGTTVLGLLAIRDIRRSRGALVGLPLAVADALLFPLLLLDLLILAVLITVVRTVWLPIESGWPVLGVSVAASLGLDALLIWATWRSVQTPIEGPVEQSAHAGRPRLAVKPRKTNDEGPTFASAQPNRLLARVLIGLMAGVLLVGTLVVAAVYFSRTDDRPARLMAAIRDGNLPLVESLIGADRDLLEWRDAERLTPLNLAVFSGDTAIVESLLSKGAEVDTSDVYGETPLMKAAGLGHIAIATALLDAGAEVNERTSQGNTALMLAATRGHLGVVKLLVEHDAEVNHVNSGGETPLMRAVAGGHREIIDFLLSHGADVSHLNHRGYGVLHYAATNEQFQELRMAGAPVSAADLFRQGYLLATDGRYAEAAEYFSEARQTKAELRRELQMEGLGWSYRFSNLSLALPIMLAECYVHSGDPEAARALLVDLEAPWNQAGGISLYERSQSMPGLELSEQYSLSRGELERFRQSLKTPVTLEVSRNEVQSDFNRRSTSTTGGTTTGLFH